MDAMCVARNVVCEILHFFLMHCLNGSQWLDPRLVPGGGATEMTLSQALREKSKSIQGIEQWPYLAVALALEVIPRSENGILFP